MFTNLGLVEYVKSKLELPTIYMLGGFGRKLTKAQIDRRINELKCQHTIKNKKIIEKGIGKYCFDCVGLIKGYIWETEPGKVGYNVPKGSDQNTDMMYANNSGMGTIKTMPELPGLIVYMKGHTGVYIGNGEVVEATPAFGAWGVTKTKLSQRNWTHWLKYKFIEYIEPAIEQMPVLKTHTVKRGENISLIAKKHNVKWQDVAKLNNIHFPWIIYPGQVLKIQEPASRVYIVKRGDSLSKISNKFSVPIDVIYQDNIRVIGSNKDFIIPGQKLIIREWFS